MQNTFLFKLFYGIAFLNQNIKVRREGVNPYPQISLKSANSYQFNPSSVILSGSLYTVWREVDKNGERELYIGKEKIKAKGFEINNLSEQIKIQNPSIKWVGDSRLFIYLEKIFLVFDTGHSEIPNRLFIAQLDSTGKILTKIKEVIKLDTRHPIEKNWNFFSEGKRLYAIYRHIPFEVLELVEENNEFMFFKKTVHHEIMRNNSRIRGEIRGTSTPIRIGNQFVSTTHSSIQTRKGLVYQSHFFIFSSDYPFRPMSFSADPINYAPVRKLFKSKVKLNSAVHQVEFPSGAFKIGRKIVIGYGLNDFTIGVKVFSISRIINQKNSIKSDSNEDNLN
jgi:hypothetical protein